MATAQAVLGLLVVRRMQRNNFDVIAPLSCALLSLPFQCALNLLKGVALLTFWKTDDESASQNIEVPGERNLPWSWDFNEGRLGQGHALWGVLAPVQGEEVGRYTSGGKR